MDKIAMYEEMILDDVFEKEAGAMNRFLRNVDKAEEATGLTAKLPRLERALNDGVRKHHNIRHNAGELMNIFQDNAGHPLEYWYNRSLLREAKQAIGATPYKGNTGLTGRRTEELGKALERNKQLQHVKKQQGIVDSLKTKHPSISGVLFR